jgi:hypothetical protein
MHLAYLHFYLAMSHDTMAREATWKHRAAELDLAEKHYLAALNAVSIPDQRKLVEVTEQSPTSPASDDDLAVKGRRASDASQQSIASSATSIADEEDMQATPTKKPSSAFAKARTVFETSSRPSTPLKSLNQFPSPSKPPPTPKKRPAPIITPNAAQAYHEEQFSSDLCAFIAMIKTHLANVVQLKETTPAPGSAARASYVRSRSSTLASRPVSRDSMSEGEQGQKTRRRTLSIRPKFDPESVRQLCNEALAEL